MNCNGFEIERKFIISMPDLDWLAARGMRTEIVQTYLKSAEPGFSDRVRARSDGQGSVVYTHTMKRRINDLRRLEQEAEISREEYLELLRRADPERQVINKSRYVLTYQGQEFEIDIYPFWQDRAVLEIELSSEDEMVVFPPEIHIIKEVTADRRYTNASMAREIPAD